MLKKNININSQVHIIVNLSYDISLLVRITGKVENFHVHVNFNLHYVNLDLHYL